MDFVFKYKPICPEKHQTMFLSVSEVEIYVGVFPEKLTTDKLNMVFIFNRSVEKYCFLDVLF